MNNKSTQYFYTVDFLRGIGALIILVWHYHHFYFSEAYFTYSGHNPVWTFEVQPFYQYLKILYHQGGWAVQFFWMLSGFVFANVYLNSNITFKEFFINRFARLYPLHFITLITITIFQFINLQYNGHYQIVGNIDFYHFILHIFFVSNWGFETIGTYSFNSVIWSVSVEVLVYAIFYTLLHKLNKKPMIISISIIIFSFILQIKFGLIWQCIFYFFSGLFVYLLTKKVSQKKLLLFDILLIVSSPVILKSFYHLLNYYLIETDMAKYIELFNGMTFKGILALFMGGGILLAAYFDITKKFENFNNIFSWVGNNTYSTYLWHLPIQVFILFFIDYLQISRNIFNSELIFIMWIVTIITIGRLSYIYIEAPSKKFIKDKFSE